MNIELKKVTPAMAEKWLKKNHPKNRKVSRGEMLKRGDPAFALRSWLEANRRALQPWDSALACLNCVTHFLCSRELRSVYSGEAGYRFVTTKRRTLKLPNTPGADVVITLTKPGFEK